MVDFQLAKFKSKVKNYTITEDALINRINKYKNNLQLSFYEKKFINIKDLKFNNNESKTVYSSLNYVDKNEMLEFMLSGGLQFAFPINNNNEVLTNIDKILVLKEAIDINKLPASSKVLCYVVENHNSVTKSKNNFDIIIPKHYYELLFFKEFYSKLLSKKQITEQIKTLSDEFNFKDQFISINEDRYEALENYPFLTDEYLFALYKKKQLNIRKFPIKDILKNK
jgi:hypothetical protein